MTKDRYAVTVTDLALNKLREASNTYRQGIITSFGYWLAVKDVLDQWPSQWQAVITEYNRVKREVSKKGG